MSRRSREQILHQRISQMLSEGDTMKTHIESAIDMASKSVDMLKDVKDEHFSQYFKLVLHKIDEIFNLFMNFNDSMEEMKPSQIFSSEEMMGYLNDTEHTHYDENKSECSTVSINDWKMKSSSIEQFYCENNSFECVVIHSVDPFCIYVVPMKYSQEYKYLLSELGKHHNDSTSTKFTNKTELLNTKFTQFAIFDDINDVWCRAIVNNLLENEVNHVEMFSMDTGRKFVLDISKIYILDQNFIDAPVYLKKLQLGLIQPFNDSQGEWSKECIDYLQDLELKSCTVLVVEIMSDLLLVHLTHENVDVSVEMGLKNLVKFSNDEENKVKEEHIGLESKNDAFTSNQSESYDFFQDENVGCDIQVKFDSVNLNDEKILCKFYKGPPDTTCFKGNRCKKIHKLFDKNGLTMERVPINLVSSIDLPNPNSVMNVVITCIKTCRNIYIQFLSYEKSSADDYYFKLNEDFKMLEFSMNKPHNIASMKNYENYPSEGEIVAAFYSKSEMWHRARVISTSHDSVELFFIDYGYQSEIHLKDIRKLNLKNFEIPQQAVECNIVNVKEECPNKESEARDSFLNMISDKKITAVVKYSQSANNTIGVILLDDGFDIAGTLHAYGLVNVCDGSSDGCFSNEIRRIPG